MFVNGPKATIVISLGWVKINCPILTEAGVVSVGVEFNNLVAVSVEPQAMAIPKSTAEADPPIPSLPCQNLASLTSSSTSMTRGSEAP